MTPEILYQDNYLIAVNKPTGILVHKTALDKNETVFVLQALRNHIGKKVYPVHRLDRPTGGVLLFALTPETAQRMNILFAQQQIRKVYHAVVRGWLPETGIINYPLSYQYDKIADRDRNHQKPAQNAVTDYRTLKRSEQPWKSSSKHATSRYSLVELIPHTGRKHQLRRHMKHIFHPILGDSTYGDHRQNKAMLLHAGNSRLMLHAYSLSFSHPHTQEYCHITAKYDCLWQHITAVLFPDS